MVGPAALLVVPGLVLSACAGAGSLGGGTAPAPPATSPSTAEAVAADGPGGTGTGTGAVSSDPAPAGTEPTEPGGSTSSPPPAPGSQALADVLFTEETLPIEGYEFRGGGAGAARGPENAIEVESPTMATCIDQSVFERTERGYTANGVARFMSPEAEAWSDIRSANIQLVSTEGLPIADSAVQQYVNYRNYTNSCATMDVLPLPGAGLGDSRETEVFTVTDDRWADENNGTSVHCYEALAMIDSTLEGTGSLQGQPEAVGTCVAARGDLMLTVQLTHTKSEDTLDDTNDDSEIVPTQEDRDRVSADLMTLFTAQAEQAGIPLS